MKKSDNISKELRNQLSEMMKLSNLNDDKSAQQLNDFAKKIIVLYKTNSNEAKALSRILFTHLQNISKPEKAIKFYSDVIVSYCMQDNMAYLAKISQLSSKYLELLRKNKDIEIKKIEVEIIEYALKMQTFIKYYIGFMEQVYKLIKDDNHFNLITHELKSYKNVMLTTVEICETMYEILMHPFIEVFIKSKEISMINTLELAIDTKIVQQKFLKNLSLLCSEIKWPVLGKGNIKESYIQKNLQELIKDNEKIILSLNFILDEEKKIKESRQVLQHLDELKTKAAFLQIKGNYNLSDECCKEYYKIATKLNLCHHIIEANSLLITNYRLINLDYINNFAKANSNKQEEYKTRIIENFEHLIVHLNEFTEFSILKGNTYLQSDFDLDRKRNNQEKQLQVYRDINALYFSHEWLIQNNSFTLATRHSLYSYLYFTLSRAIELLTQLDKQGVKVTDFEVEYVRILEHEKEENLLDALKTLKQKKEACRLILEPLEKELERIRLDLIAHDTFKEKEVQKKLEHSNRLNAKYIENHRKEKKTPELKSAKKNNNREKQVKNIDYKNEEVFETTSEISHMQKLCDEATMLLMVGKYSAAEKKYLEILGEVNSKRDNIFIPKLYSCLADCYMGYVSSDLRKISKLKTSELRALNQNLEKAINYENMAINHIENSNLDRVLKKDLLYSIDLALSRMYAEADFYLLFIKKYKEKLSLKRDEVKAEIIQKYGVEAWYRNDPDKTLSLEAQRLKDSDNVLNQVEKNRRNIKELQEKQKNIAEVICEQREQEFKISSNDLASETSLLAAVNISMWADRVTINRPRSSSLPALATSATKLPLESRKYQREAIINPRSAVDKLEYIRLQNQQKEQSNNL